MHVDGPMRGPPFSPVALSAHLDTRMVEKRPHQSPKENKCNATECLQVEIDFCLIKRERASNVGLFVGNTQKGKASGLIVKVGNTPERQTVK